MISDLSPVPHTRIAIGIRAITGNERNRSIVAFAHDATVLFSAKMRPARPPTTTAISHAMRTQRTVCHSAGHRPPCDPARDLNPPQIWIGPGNGSELVILEVTSNCQTTRSPRIVARPSQLNLAN